MDRLIVALEQVGNQNDGSKRAISFFREIRQLNATVDPLGAEPYNRSYDTTANMIYLADPRIDTRWILRRNLRYAIRILACYPRVN